MARVIIPLVGFALAVFALVDCIQTPPERVKHLPKPLWIAIIILGALVGPIAWIIAGKERRLRGGPRRANPGPRGPDDDPDFLRGL